MSRSSQDLSFRNQIGIIYILSLEIYRHCLDIDDAMDAFVMDLSAVISLAKLLILRLNSKHTWVLINSVVNDWSTVHDSRHEYIMMEYLKKGRIVSLMILYLGYASGFSFIVKALPFGDILPFQVRQSLLSFDFDVILQENNNSL